MGTRIASGSIAIAFLWAWLPHTVNAGDQQPLWNEAQKALHEGIDKLRGLADTARPAATIELAQQIRSLPASANKLRLALELSELSTEGDLGHDTVEAAATTLSQSLREAPLPWVAPPSTDDGKFKAALLPAYGYRELATLVRYEHTQGALTDDVHYRAAVSALRAQDRKREVLDFKLTDLTSTSWSLHALRGKVVLVNFWATWCPPCRQEIPALDELYQQFGPQGFVVLGLSDEDSSKVKPFVEKNMMSYPVLLDEHGAVKKAFSVNGIPQSLLYDRNGHLVAQAMDGRSKRQFAEMLKAAGLGSNAP